MSVWGAQGACDIHVYIYSTHQSTGAYSTFAVNIDKSGNLPLSLKISWGEHWTVHTVYQVRLDLLPLPCIALIWPSQLSCLGSSVVEHLPSKQYVVGSSPT